MPEMKALLCEAFGLPETLRIGQTEIPAPGPKQIRIRVEAAGLNFPDALIIQNKYQLKPILPFTPGGEAAGYVDAVGQDVTSFRPGDRVAALTMQGAFAQYVIADEHRAALLPPAMDFTTAGGFTLTYGTAHHALRQRANLQPGETVLILGAAGGVGLAAVEVAKQMGAKVVAGASTDEKLTICRAAGADEVINYTTEDLRAGIRRTTGKAGPDVIYDPLGDRFSEPAFRSIAWGGRYLVIGFAAGDIPSLPLNLPLIKGAAIVGVWWGEFVDRAPAVHQSNMAELFGWYGAGALKPLVSKLYTLDESREALRFMMDRQATGKIIITVA